MARRHKTREQLAEPAYPVVIRSISPEDAVRMTALRSDGCRPSPLTGTANWSRPSHPRSAAERQSDTAD
jgi:hypothetical protein